MFTLDTMLEHHLVHNHYPPLPLALVPVAKVAIEHARADELDHEIPLATLSFRGKRSVSVRDAIETMHLEGFLAVEFPEEDAS